VFVLGLSLTLTCLLGELLQHDNSEIATPLVFISYRRSDSQQAALGLYVQLRARIGPASVFMDRSGISPGNVWSERLREEMNKATVVLALIGSGWLTSADEYGRRRLDMSNDWVRNELLAAIDSGKSIIPILLSPLLDMPATEGLPDSLRPLRAYQAFSLHDDHWDSDLNNLVRLLVDDHGFKETDRKVVLPTPAVSIASLTQAELDKELQVLSGWEPVESLIPGDYPRSRHELRKVYVFKSFRAAVHFMNSAVDAINAAKHHPRWENQRKTVTVYLSTWDIGFRISRLDIDLAKILDSVYVGGRSAKADP
jgi:pterin-4a-carbinolamine dehydratase